MATRAYAEPEMQPEISGPVTLENFYADPLLAVPAWGFTNPIFIDVDGDTNNDGDPFEALYIKRGWSPVL